ncbi:MAG: Fluoroacetyl-CoA thioesterase [Firmicutes bacterium ADurb.Bin248]|nr:MAG: Fluoroacetyl-CoA thioesterase [Firmicutes bacterium ADurb.Bin248]HOG00060.1 thioesterase family protein [Clostridia bacterium]HPK15016.1 thioesterase family protein [Clostridia bacterium]
MNGNLRIGTKGTARAAVDETTTAAAMGSGDLPVFATPALVALMEKAAANSVARDLEPGYTSVGCMIRVEHVSATPAGSAVRCESELVGIEGRKLRFALAAYDDAGLIGHGTHERFVVEREKFMKKAEAKAAR